MDHSPSPRAASRACPAPRRPEGRGLRATGPSRVPCVASLLALLLVLPLLAPGPAHAAPQSSRGGRRADANAAETYRAAWTLLNEKNVPIGLSDDEWNLLMDSATSGTVDPANVDRVRMLMDRITPLRDAVLGLGSFRKSDFDLDRSKGFELMLPHLSKMRATARLLVMEASLADAEGNWERGLAAMGAMAAVSSHAGQDKVLISSLVGAAVGSLSMRSVDAALDSGRLDQAKAQQLLDALRPVEGGDAFHFSDAVLGEFDLLASTVRGKSPQELAALVGGQDGEGDQESARQLAELSSADMRREVRRAEGLDAKAAAAFESGQDPAVARAVMAEIEREAAKSPVLKLLMPALTKCLEGKLRTEAAIAERTAKLRLLAEGKKSAAELANGAAWLRRAAAMARGLAVPEQEAVEVVRLGGSAVDGELRDAAARVHRATGEAIRAAVVQGLACGRVDFDDPSERDTGASLQWLPGLRGACRVLLSRAMVAPPDEAAALTALVAEVAVRLSRDPSLTRSVVAAQLADECIPVLGTLTQDHAPTQESVDELQRSLQRLAAAEGFGIMKAVDADRDRLAASWGGKVDPEKRKAIGRKSAEFVLFVVVALALPEPLASAAEAAGKQGAGGAAEAAKPFDPGPLLNFDDVLPPVRVQETMAQRAALGNAPFFRSWLPFSEDDSKPEAPFKGVQPVTVRDYGTDVGRAAEVAARLGDAASRLRGAAARGDAAPAGAAAAGTPRSRPVSE